MDQYKTTMMKKFSQLLPVFLRHVTTRQMQPYERMLAELQTRPDIWCVSQGQYMAWWLERANTTLNLTVANGVCHIETPLADAVIEIYPGKLVQPLSFPCPQSNFAGEVFIALHPAIEKRELCVELLKLEGILNVRVTDHGPFLITQDEVGPLLDDIDTQMQRQQLSQAKMASLRQIVIDKLALQCLPLMRLWYHPRRGGHIIRAVFSPRFDVDRAITNVPRIRALEQRYGASSTWYIRPFGPFYADRAIQRLAAASWCSELALHGEFLTNARRFSDEYGAACAEKEHLESLAHRPVQGISMHGGELTTNRSSNTDAAMVNAGFVYDTTPSSGDYNFPFKKMVAGRLVNTYNLPCILSDIRLSPFSSQQKILNDKIVSYYPALGREQLSAWLARNQNELMYEQIATKMDEIYSRHGVFVLLLHPVYFGFFAYLSHPTNWRYLAKYLATYTTQAFNTR
jgi:hypothetical protein